MENIQDFGGDPRTVPVDAIGGELLDGSGFEIEMPATDFVFSNLGGEL